MSKVLEFRGATPAPVDARYLPKVHAHIVQQSSLRLDEGWTRQEAFAIVNNTHRNITCALTPQGEPALAIMGSLDGQLQYYPFEYAEEIVRNAAAEVRTRLRFYERWLTAWAKAREHGLPTLGAQTQTPPTSTTWEAAAKEAACVQRANPQP